MKFKSIRHLPKRAFVAATFICGIAIGTPSVAQQVLTVGTTPTGAPFSSLDTKTNTPQGVYIDILAEISKETGIKFDIQEMQFSSLIPSLTSKKLDLIACPMSITPARQAVINFSTPIYTYGEALIVPKSQAAEYTKLEDLKGATVGGQIGGVYIDTLKKSGLFSDVKAYETFIDVVHDVDAGRTNAALVDYPVMAYNIGLGKFPNTRIVETYKPINIASIGLAFRKDQPDLLNKMNASLEKLQASGELAKILSKWGLKANGS
ncbi:substrate-binding periplasmic protein [Rhizobium rhizogenes]|uniref:substrate-binding periplasmic protein n=1 Tax=Rhizobium rhizogenes TaxID=359 RepID=UPI00157468BA|nr:ABC transporter substrate-binding protein [Rhizobium rhizogenes]NTH21844.1 amino acid ABC transporter substrate-binding protein [Rhizobium rhizogenes]NTH34987.1 amino acid ABC transporter substrate-binding protein [Rhizobium rhizogenes]